MRGIARTGCTLLLLYACGGGPAPGPGADRRADLDASLEQGTPEAAEVEEDVAKADAPRDGGPDEPDLGPEPEDRAAAREDQEALDPGADAETDLLETEPEPCPEDGLSCTTVSRHEEGDCITTLAPGFCLIGGICYFSFQPDPENPCLFCVPDQDPLVFLPFEGLPCDDGDPCTSGDTCGPDGSCRPGVATDCNDLNVCTLDQCKPGVGCVHAPYESACDDQNACTYQDHCEQGKCVGLKLPCQDTNPCTDDVCDPAVGCRFVFNEAPCDDGNACTQQDRCEGGSCSGSPVDCDDGDPCTVDSCLESFGCRHDWYYGACEDGNACTVNDFCNAAHECVGYPAVCNDFNPCTDDRCDPAIGCVADFNENPCDDGDPCTVGDACREGRCSGTPKDCEDGNLCTLDSCDAFGCHHEPTTGACDDHNACTISDSCATGSCIGIPADCDDHNPCTSDSCDPKTGCVHEPAPGLCDDGDPCTSGDHCEAGVCAGAPKDCSDGDPCTSDVCEGSGSCTHLPYSGACDDGNACTVGDACHDGVCAGSPRDCDDQNPCTVDACNPVWGCVHAPTEPKPCDDHSVCTTGDRCAGGVCAGTAILCLDGNPCTRDECDPSTGCVFVPFEGPCDDGNICTVEDRCSGGACTGTSVFTGLAGNSATIAIGVSGNPGQGLDVDQNPATCEPKGSCVKGIDNAFASLAWLFNPELTRATKDGTFAMLLEWRPDAAGQTGTLNVMFGERRPGAACDPTKPGCEFSFYPGMVSGTCEPLFSLAQATLDGNHLSAHSTGGPVPMFLVFGTLRVQFLVKSAWLDATLSLSGGGGLGQGILAGGVPKQDLLSSIGSAPEDQFPPPYTRDLVMQYVSLVLQPDLDLDHDGSPESISIGIPFTLVSAHLVGPL